jgi:hypothetical protein
LPLARKNPKPEIAKAQSHCAAAFSLLMISRGVPLGDAVMARWSRSVCGCRELRFEINLPLCWCL